MRHDHLVDIRVHNKVCIVRNDDDLSTLAGISKQLYEL